MNESLEPIDRNDLIELRAEVQRLRHDVDQLRRENATLQARPVSAPPVERQQSRRTVLRLAGAAAAGAAAASLSGTAKSAVAADDPMTAGWHHPATRSTSIAYGAGTTTINSVLTPGSTNSLVRVDSTGLAGSVGLDASGAQWGLLGYAGEELWPSRQLRNARRHRATRPPVTRR